MNPDDDRKRATGVFGPIDVEDLVRARALGHQMSTNVPHCVPPDAKNFHLSFVSCGDGVMAKSGQEKRNVSLTLGMTLAVSCAIPTSAAAGLFGPEPITGLCFPDHAEFVQIINRYNYKLAQTSEARNGRRVELYRSGAEYMIAVADEQRSSWCVQFTSEDRDEFIRFLLGRYDPTTRGDEGTD